MPATTGDDVVDDAEDDVVLLLFVLLDITPVTAGNGGCCACNGEDVVDDGNGIDVNLNTCFRFV